jgi:integrase
MALTLYRRHRTKCEGGHDEDARSGEFEEGRRGWKRCGCLIHVSGTLGGNFRRKDTGKSDWDEARAVATAWEAAQSWDGAAKIEQPAPPAPAVPDGRMTIADVLGAYLAGRAARGPRPATMGKYRTFTKQLREWAENKGYVYLDQFTTTDMDAFYASWKGDKSSRGKKLERAKGFWNFCRKRNWITANPMEDLEPPVGYSIVKNKSPFTDEELGRIFDAAAAWKPCPWHNRGEHGVIDADMVVAFTMLLLETGLRISDASTFNVAERINPDNQECFLYMHKTGKPLFTWINPELYARLCALVKTLGPTPFITQSRDPQQAGDSWRERLAKVFSDAGPFKEHPVPHRFRHTFVRVQLQRGVSVDDVAELIGDTPDMVRRHYARWVPERQERLTGLLKQAYEQSRQAKWRNNLREMPKTGTK